MFCSISGLKLILNQKSPSDDQDKTWYWYECSYEKCSLEKSIAYLEGDSEFSWLGIFPRDKSKST